MTTLYQVTNFLIYLLGRLTLQGMEIARKGKWMENGRFYRSVEFAENGIGKETVLKLCK